MTEFHEYFNPRSVYDLTGYDPNDFDEYVLLCVPRFAWFVARGLMADYGTRPINYSVQNTEAGYFSPDSVLFDQIDEAVSQFLGADDMCQSLETAVQNVADQLAAMNATMIASAQCDSSCNGQGSNGAGTTDPPPSGYVDDGASPPPPFATVEEYRTYKCGAANLFVDQIQSDLTAIQTASILTLAASTLAITLITPIPFDDIIALSAITIAYLGQGLLGTYAGNIVAAINAAEVDYVCDIYNAETAQEAYDNLQLRISNESGLNAAEKYLASFFVTIEAMNRLFDYSTVTAQQTQPGGVDCADCECPIFGTQWTVIERTDTYLIVESQPGATESFAYASMRTKDADAVTGGGGPFGPYCGIVEPYTVTLVSGTVTDYGTRDDAGTVGVPAWTAWNGASPLNLNIRHLYTRDTAKSTYRLKLEKT